MMLFGIEEKLELHMPFFLDLNACSKQEGRGQDSLVRHATLIHKLSRRLGLLI